MRAAIAGVVALALLSPQAAKAEEPGYRFYATTAKFEDIRDDLKDAIIKRGFVIDYTGHLNDMLKRTADTSGKRAGTERKSPYVNAEFMQFCPSALTHEAVSANPLAILSCPIALVVYETSQEKQNIHVGFRKPVDSPSRLSTKINAKIIAVLDEIAREVTKKKK